MIKDAEMRSKAKLIDGFIQKNVDDDKENFMIQRDKADGTSDLEERLNTILPLSEKMPSTHWLRKRKYRHRY